MWTRLGHFDGRPETRRAAFRDFCAETLDLAENRLSLAHDRLGAPLLLIDGVKSEVAISSSSREDVYLFGLTREGRIGVDVEILRPIDPPESALHPEERQRLAAMPEAERLAAFYEIWTAKEAYLKALGVGLRKEPSTLIAPSSATAWRKNIAGKIAICSALTLKP